MARVPARRAPAARPADRPPRPRRRKALGQHHLRDGRAALPLLDFLGVRGRTVVEIGPGGGALTRELLARGARVLAVEVDPAWAFALPGAAAPRVAVGGAATRDAASAVWRGERLPESAVAPSPEPAAAVPETFLFFPFPGAGRLSVAVADALEIDWERLPPGAMVAGNLPYNVGTPILERLLAHAPPGTRAGFLLQREVVDRLVAEPGSKAYGALSVLVAARASVRRLATLPPGAFVPPPRVESSFVGLELRAAPEVGSRWSAFEAVVRAAFAQRRKTLRNALGAVHGLARAEAALAALGIPRSERAERLSLEQFARLGEELARA